MKKIKVALLGCGNRGKIYADYSLRYPEQMEVVAVIDQNNFKLEQAKKRYSITSDMAFSSLDEFISKKIPCDLVIDAVLDGMHFITAKKLLIAGYDILLEKPITQKLDELLELKDLANTNNCNIFVCHVLRYTPFYSRIKKLIHDGELGEIYSMELDEHVWMVHFVASYVRGKYNNEKESGSPLLLAKCSHDADLMCWFNNDTSPAKVSSFGSRRKFRLENKPEGASDFCYKCKFVDTCEYSAKRMHLDFKFFDFLTWVKLAKPLDEITREEKEEHLKTDNYGRCVYDAGCDVVDRQTVAVEFENGSVGTLTVVGGVPCGERYISISGEKGEIKGYFEEGVINLYKLTIDENNQYKIVKKKFDVNEEIDSTGDSGHGGGDFAIMNSVLKYINGERGDLSITSINDSIKGHLLCFAAEKSRKEGRIVSIDEIVSSRN